MTKISKTMFFVLAFFVSSNVAFANMIAPDPAAMFVTNFLIVLFISLIEIFVIKFGLEIGAWKSFYTVLIANVVTTLIGVIFFQEFLEDFHSSKITLVLTGHIILIFIATFLVEAAVLQVLITEVEKRKIYKYCFLGNLISYLVYIVLVNIPYIL